MRAHPECAELLKDRNFLEDMDHVSPEDYDDDGMVSGTESIGEDSEVKQESPQTSTSAQTGAKKGVSSVKLGTHLQKRRRVTRACDECRRKKIKCDGKQPCTHCTVYSYGSPYCSQGQEIQY